MNTPTTTPRRIGLIAGRGRYPMMFCEAARRQGVEHLAVVGMHEETDPAIEALCDSLDWVYVGQLNKAIKALKRHNVAHVVFAGQIKPGRLFKGLRPDLRAVKLLGKLREKNADSIFSGMAAEFEKDGITVLPATTFLEDQLASVGPMGRHKPNKEQLADIELGWRTAREVSRLDIGQTVVVRTGTIVAVEAFEGTDRAIRRGGEVANGSVRVIKVAKPHHDMRFDVPCIGLRTVESLRQAGADVLALQARMALFLDRDETIAELDKLGIVVYGIDENTFPS
jgi:DUF1009 family protein